MTAAHCLDHATPSLLVAGDQNTVVVDSKNEQRLHVEKIIKHPNWSHEGIGINDIAIIKLQVPVEWKENVQPICLPGTKCCHSVWKSLKSLISNNTSEASFSLHLNTF